MRDHHLRKTYKLRDFKSALAFADRAGAMAEEQGHHPDLQLAWGMVVVEIWTHKNDGLTESDFVFAAKCEAVEPTRQPDVAEPDLREHCEELSLRESASDSTGPEIRSSSSRDTLEAWARPA